MNANRVVSKDFRSTPQDMSKVRRYHSSVGAATLFLRATAFICNGLCRRFHWLRMLEQACFRRGKGILVSERESWEKIY